MPRSLSRYGTAGRDGSGAPRLGSGRADTHPWERGKCERSKGRFWAAVSQQMRFLCQTLKSVSWRTGASARVTPWRGSDASPIPRKIRAPRRSAGAGLAYDSGSGKLVAHPVAFVNLDRTQG